MGLLKLILLPLMAHSLQWSDMEAEHKYLLNEDIAINDSIKLSKGDALLLEDVMSGEVPVIFYTFKNHMCSDPSQTAEMVIYKGMGVELQSDCKVEIYVEPTDYYSESFFSDAANEFVQSRPQSSVR